MCNRNDCLIGIGSTILNKAKIGKNSIIGANALVTENKVIPERSLVLGSPGKIVRQVTDEEIKSIKEKLLFSKKYEYKKIINVETIEDNEANLKSKVKTNQTIPKIKKNLYDRANITPR